MSEFIRHVTGGCGLIVIQGGRELETGSDGLANDSGNDLIGAVHAGNPDAFDVDGVEGMTLTQALDFGVVHGAYNHPSSFETGLSKPDVIGVCNGWTEGNGCVGQGGDDCGVNHGERSAILLLTRGNFDGGGRGHRRLAGGRVGKDVIERREINKEGRWASGARRPSVSPRDTRVGETRGPIFLKLPRAGTDVR